jgi:hypothetical protein
MYAGAATSGRSFRVQTSRRTHPVAMLESELKPRPRHIVSGRHVASGFNMEATIFLPQGTAIFGVMSLSVRAEIQDLNYIKYFYLMHFL